MRTAVVMCVHYTDGVTEAMNGQEKMFSEDRLRAELSAASVGSAQDLATNMPHRVKAYTGDVPQADDIAVLVLRRQPDRGTES